MKPGLGCAASSPRVFPVAFPSANAARLLRSLLLFVCALHCQHHLYLPLRLRQGSSQARRRASPASMRGAPTRKEAEMYGSHKLALTTALAIGVAAGSYGIANAASGSGTSRPHRRSPPPRRSPGRRRPRRRAGRGAGSARTRRRSPVTRRARSRRPRRPGSPGRRSSARRPTRTATPPTRCTWCRPTVRPRPST